MTPQQPDEKPEVNREPKISVNNAEELMLAEQERRMELLRKVRTLRERATLDRGKISGGDLDKDYIWVCNDERSQAEFQGLDYRVCTNPKVESKYKQADNTHRRGDLILYEVDRELREAYHFDSAYRSIEQLEESFMATQFRQFAAGAGVPVHLKERASK